MKQKNQMQGISHIRAFSRLFYPVTCPACGLSLMDKETILCTVCRYTLPTTDYHTLPQNPLEQLFVLRIRVDFISSFLYFDQGLSTQRMLHAIKYKGNKLLAVLLGEVYGHDIRTRFSYPPEYIIPVPLHKRKQRERGYNQSEYWAMGLSKSIGAELDTKTLWRKKYTTTQTRKSRADRIKNVTNVFQLSDPEKLKGTSVLLVDDVITTGATLESCGELLWSAGIKSLNIATIAYAIK